MAELLPNFYKVTHSEHINETDWVVQVMLNPQHAIYSGHFPQQPVVPGVCMSDPAVKGSIGVIRRC